MKKSASIAVIILFAFMIAGCGSGASSGKVLVDINGDKITEGDLDFLGEINPRIKAQIDNPVGKKRILDNLVEQEVLYQEAVKEGVNRDPKVKAKVDLYRRVIIAQSLVDKEIENAAKKYYDEHPEEFKKLKLSQIMVKYESPEDIQKAKKSKGKQKLHTEQEALKIAGEIKAKIDKGESFEKVASESSEDVATKSRGGDIGLVSKDDKKLEGRGYGPLIEKAFEMKVGEVSGPVKTSKGYHLITVTRGVEPETFEEAKQGITFKMRGDARNDLLARLKKESTIVYPEEEKQKAEAKKKADEAKKTLAAKAAEKKAGDEQKPTVKPKGEKAEKPAAEKKQDKAESKQPQKK